VTTVFVLEGNGAGRKPLACPATFHTTTSRPWVPSVADRVDTNGRIAPVRLPTDVVVCSYRRAGAVPGSKPLTGSKALHGSFTALVSTVAYLPRATSSTPRCAASFGAGDDYLLGLTYSDGVEWITASENQCLAAATTNGEHDSPALLAVEVRTAYRTGRWPSADGKRPCATISLGRFGQEAKLVPDGVTSADVCKRMGAAHAGHRHLDAGDAGRLADTLDRLRTSRAPRFGVGCFGWDSSSPGADYLLVFHYGVGADTVVHVDTSPQCGPGVSNGSLLSTARTTTVRTVEHLLGGH
jgi:hypothetical protein